MTIQLSQEQQRRIQVIVEAGAYPSAEEALDAAVAVVEAAASEDFEGCQEELDMLLSDGLNSGEPVEADEGFWDGVREQTDRMVAEHQARKPRS